MMQSALEASGGVPSVLHLMAQDLTSRHIVKQLTGELKRALRQAASPYSFVREQALLCICSVLDKAASARRPPGLTKRLLDEHFKDVVATALDTFTRFQEQQPVGGDRPSVSVNSLAVGELEAALQVSQGLALVHKQSRALFIANDAITQLLLLLPKWRGSCASSTLDVLLSLQIGSPSAQAQFIEGEGFQQVASLYNSGTLSSDARRHSLDVLALLLQCVHPQPPSKASLRQIEKVLGKGKCSDLLRSEAVQMGGPKDSDEVSASLLQHLR